MASATTSADIISEKFLVTHTKQIVPSEIQVFGEEMATGPEANPGWLSGISFHPKRDRILFDSIDGTISYMEMDKIKAGTSPLFLDGFASMMSYVSGGEIKAAIIHRPLACRKQTYVMIADAGVWIDGEEVRTIHSDQLISNQYKLAADHMFSAKPELLGKRPLPFIKTTHHWHSNHAAHFAVERPDTIFLMYPNAKPWDMAPAAAFYRAMGGDVVAVGTGVPYRFGAARSHCFVGVPHAENAQLVARRLAQYLAPECVAR